MLGVESDLNAFNFFQNQFGAFSPHTPLLPLPKAERRKRHNFRATSKAGFPLCAAVLTSLWITFDLSSYMEMDLTNGSDGGAFSTFAQLCDVMLL